MIFDFRMNKASLSKLKLLASTAIRFKTIKELTVKKVMTLIMDKSKSVSSPLKIK